MTHAQYMAHLRALAIATGTDPSVVDDWLKCAGIYRASEWIAVKLWLNRQYDETLAWFLQGPATGKASVFES